MIQSKSSIKAAVMMAAWTFAACAQEGLGLDPPAQAFFYPMGMAVSPSGQYVYVVNSNFDQRFNAGWLSVVDLDVVLAAVDEDQPNPTWGITQELRVPSLAGDISLNAAGTQALLPHRGVISDRSLITVIDVSADEATLSCGESRNGADLATAESRTECDREHILQLRREDLGLSPGFLFDPYPADVFTVSVLGEEPLQLGVVGFLRSDVLAVLDMSGPLPAVLQGISLPRGVTRVRSHPDTSGSFLAATSRGANQSTIYSVDMTRTIVEGRPVVIQHPLHPDVGGGAIVDLVFSPDGQYAFISNRDPDSIVSLSSRIVDVQEPNGTVRQRPQYATVSAQAMPGRPSELLYVPRTTGDILVVTNYTDDSLYVVAVQAGQLLPAERIRVGFGPYGIAHAQWQGRELLLVSNFLDHSLSVLDISAAELADFRVLTTIKSGELEEAERL